MSPDFGLDSKACNGKAADRNRFQFLRLDGARCVIVCATPIDLTAEDDRAIHFRRRCEHPRDLIESGLDIDVGEIVFERLEALDLAVHLDDAEVGCNLEPGLTIGHYLYLCIVVRDSGQDVRPDIFDRPAINRDTCALEAKLELVIELVYK